jgi:hypothetical protein
MQSTMVADSGLPIAQRLVANTSSPLTAIGMAMRVHKAAGRESERRRDSIYHLRSKLSGIPPTNPHAMKPAMSQRPKIMAM